MIGLVHDRPDDPLTYIQSCMDTAKEIGGPKFVVWDSFIGCDLPPEMRTGGENLIICCFFIV